MEFPYGHHRHGHDHRQEENHQPPYPPPGTTTPYPSYPSPPHNLSHVHHHQHHPENPGFYPPPPLPEVQHISHQTPFHPPSPFPQVQHVAHEAPPPHAPHNTHHVPSFIHHHDHHPSRPSVLLPQGQDVKVYCEAETGYSLTIRDGSVILARSNPDDQYQHWIKDEKYSTKVKDHEGFPSFALVNKATGQALQHSIGGTQPVRLTPYQPDVLDQSILWTLSKDVGHGFRTIRMVNNIRLNLDAFNGDKNHGGVHDGTVAVLWEWKKGENQRWKITPY